MIGRVVGVVGAITFACSMLFGCTTEIAHGLDETQANEVVVALEAEGIVATKEAAPGEADRFVVRCADGDVGTAISVLTSEGLPRERATGLESMFGEPSLVPTPTEERARLSAALAGDIAHSIETIDGVLSARVHLALPEPDPLGRAETSARASVLVRYRGEAAPYDEGSLRRLVAGGVEGLAERDVTIVGVRATPRSSSTRELVAVGPFATSRGTATTLKLTLLGLLVVNVFLAVALLLAVGFVRRLRERAPASESRT